MSYKQNLNFDTIFAILIANAKRKNNLQQHPTKSTPTSTASTQPTTPIKAERYADKPPSEFNSTNNRNMPNYIDYWYCGKRPHITRMPYADHI